MSDSFSVRMMKRGFYAYLLTDDCNCLKHLKYYAPQLQVMASITKGIEQQLEKSV